MFLSSFYQTQSVCQRIVKCVIMAYHGIKSSLRRFLIVSFFLKVLLWNRSVPMNDSRFFPARTVDSDLHNFTAQLFCLDDESAIA